MHFLIPVLMIICIICMRKLDIENLTKVFVILCANLFISFIITALCRGTEGEMFAMVFFVVNVIALESVGELARLSGELDFDESEIVQLSVARSRKAGRYTLMNGLNPIWIGTLQRNEGGVAHED